MDMDITEKYLKLKEQRKQATRKYQLKNKDIINEKRKIYVRNNIDKIKEISKRYYDKVKNNDDFIQKNKDRSKKYYETKKINKLIDDMLIKDF
jgi:hypothetical protein